MKLNLLAFAIPFFVSLMLLEYYLSIKKNKRIHHFEEAVANLNVGIFERLSDMLTTGAFFFVFSWIHKHYSLLHIQPSIFTWILLFLFTDFVWYWYHRLAHEVNLFWSVHVVHHQSEDFNYTASVRVTVFQAIARGMFWSILPLIGFPSEMIYILLLIHGTYPFFTHTQLIGKLGWLEYFMVTPSHHRVHHASNDEYLDKNYGDVLIIWDKMFGTFAREDKDISYGLTKPLKSYSFLWQHFHFLLEMLIAFKTANGWRRKLKIIFGRPDNIDPELRTYLEKKLLNRNSNVEQGAPLLKFITAQTILTLVVLFFTILFEHYLSATQRYTSALFIFISVISTGAMLEQRTWVFGLELVRLSLAGLFIYSFYPYPSVGTAILIMLSGILTFYRSFSNGYYSYIYQYQGT